MNPSSSTRRNKRLDYLQQLAAAEMGGGITNVVGGTGIGVGVEAGVATVVATSGLNLGMDTGTNSEAVPLTEGSGTSLAICESLILSEGIDVSFDISVNVQYTGSESAIIAVWLYGDTVGNQLRLVEQTIYSGPTSISLSGIINPGGAASLGVAASASANGIATVEPEDANISIILWSQGA